MVLLRLLVSLTVRGSRLKDEPTGWEIGALSSAYRIGCAPLSKECHYKERRQVDFLW